MQESAARRNFLAHGFGGFTMTAVALRPRMSTCTSVPALADARFTYPRAIPLFSDGESVPLVTMPTGCPLARIE